jgi:hypothetical protein
MNIYLKPDFLTDEQTALLKESVYKLQPHWKHVSKMPVNSDEVRSRYPQEIVSHAERVMENLNFLGEGIYIIDGKLSAIDKDVQDIMRKEFAWLYEIVVKHFKMLYNTPNVMLHDVLPIPGFHIFSGNVQERRDFDWHHDSTVHLLVDNVDQSSVYSFVILVESPKDTAHLDYKLPNTEDIRILEYQKNTFHMWNGSLMHRIGSFNLEQDERRITFQGHIYYDEKDNYYKIYF